MTHSVFSLMGLRARTCQCHFPVLSGGMAAAGFSGGRLPSPWCPPFSVPATSLAAAPPSLFGLNERAQSDLALSACQEGPAALPAELCTGPAVPHPAGARRRGPTRLAASQAANALNSALDSISSLTERGKQNRRRQNTHPHTPVWWCALVSGACLSGIGRLPIQGAGCADPRRPPRPPPGEASSHLISSMRQALQRGHRTAPQATPERADVC